MGSRFFLCSILASSLAWHFPFSSAAAQQITSETLELRGRVINSATGEPVALALVQVSAPGPKTQFTGADGTFVFTGLPPGHYWPLARKPGCFYLSFRSTNGGWTITYQSTSEKPEEQGYGAQFYPGVPDLESASAIEIRAGAQVHIVQTLSRQRLFQVAGVVRGADPASGFNLTLTNSMGDMVQKRV